ncbi:hypothetical protein [Mesorhizobium sp. AA22]|uniref:hypothetical protein n=1 Tax=Mesorhizobium sp. AA22 TaxID=1854057 RepID=UPI0007EC713D|nr:hypothetical protein [Mesorhizobium sp. AA22]QIA21511.1 hypothetical protein A9K68_006610 [Mesorhizobium sp. AA22]
MTAGCQAVRSLDHTPYPSAQRDILGDHFFCAFKRELGLIDALSGIGHRASVEFRSVHHDPLTHGGPDCSPPPMHALGTRLFLPLSQASKKEGH